MNGISLDEFWALLNKNGCFRGDAVVHLAYKYDFEDEYTVSNQLLMCEPDGTYCWEYDWNEGQTDVKVLGFVFVDDVEVPGF